MRRRLKSALLPSPETVTAVTALLRGEVHLLEPRKMWPGGSFGSRGRIAPDEMAGMRAQVKPVVDKYAKEVGEALMAKAQVRDREGQAEVPGSGRRR